MSFAIAAAGTGGHVFPGLAVGEALVAQGVPREQILFVGGDRLESRVYPDAGFPFLSVELRGLQRRLTLANLGVPKVVIDARRRLVDEFRERQVRVVLGMGGYVTVPAVWAGRRIGARTAVAEQNAEAGLANRVADRWADRVFGAFPRTRHLPRAEWVGNPVRIELAEFDRSTLRPRGLVYYGLDDEGPVVGVFGGSLGSGAINQAVCRLAGEWEGPPFQLVHVTGNAHFERVLEVRGGREWWKVVAFEQHMEFFYAVSDVVVARAGGAVAELLVTGTPALLVPGRFGSGRHQRANASFLEEAGAAVTVEEDRLDRLGGVLAELVFDEGRRTRMAAAARRLARPDAARSIAGVLEALHG